MTATIRALGAFDSIFGPVRIRRTTLEGSIGPASIEAEVDHLLHDNEGIVAMSMVRRVRSMLLYDRRTEGGWVRETR